MKTYPRLMDQMRDIMEEWKEEREQLLINAEQTHAYCQSLAFQVLAQPPAQRERVCTVRRAYAAT